MEAELNESIINQFLHRALEEDRVNDDVTTLLVIPDELNMDAIILAQEKGVLAGLDICSQAFKMVDKTLDITLYFQDGDVVNPGEAVIRIRGKAQGILRAERTALNVLGWMSGIASLAARFAERVKGTSAVICDTRKTKPTLRIFEKYAVKAGGGYNHRMNLADGVLIKDNHLNALRTSGKNLGEIVALARRNAPEEIKVEVEVTSYDEALQAADSGSDIILLDNMPSADMKKVAKALSGRVKLEASGGITLENVAEVAATGVDIISIGALTHSSKNMDFSLEVADY
ncbi:MAG: carboxylating nicotinate-nucleotide diphosphorylase [Dehalococcoidales bacterium]|nr:carboxylating nicotinate-nucleotide diphosphorylase [Dehalococcoidales bacterium]MDD5604452.1 carboxylating nicotinate-nucleotide diphosphorylase [Dehalococcoidales bacterium]MDX9986412.1 carboxylating nicotinate-nucleotide diphosphorylase [Dehalococcoidales bacterium]